MPDTGAAGVSTAGKSQVKALQKTMPSLKLDTTTAGGHRIAFGDNPQLPTLGTVGVKTPFGTISFAVVQANTPFLLCLNDMDKLRVFFDNTRDVLVHTNKLGKRETYPVVRKWGHPFFLLDMETTAASCHLTETELRQLHRRFGHPAADRLYKVLSRAGCDDIDEQAMQRINKFCHQCQMHSKAPGRFRFNLRDDADFNYRLIVDVMYITGKPVLHAVDEATAFQAAQFLANMTAKTTWDTLRAMWMDTYLGPPDFIVTDAGTNLKAAEFVENARLMAIEVEEIPVEAHHSIGKVERYHGPVKRAYEIIASEMRGVSAEHILQMAVKAVNDTAGPNGLVPTLLVFGAYPRMVEPPRWQHVPVRSKRQWQRYESSRHSGR